MQRCSGSSTRRDADSVPTQTRRILHYHLPPRGFWTWWCGGMAVYDALVVAAWIAINILYTQQRVALILPLFKGEHQSSIWP